MHGSEASLSSAVYTEVLHPINTTMCRLCEVKYTMYYNLRVRDHWSEIRNS